jgi:NAD-dependent deacetylase
MLDTDRLSAAEDAARECDVMLVIGTSGLVYPAAGLPLTARRAGAAVVIVNPAESELDGLAHCVVRATAATSLPRLLQRR